MPSHVLLNFEDAAGQYNGPLQASISGVNAKANVKGNQVTVIDCVELVDRYITSTPAPLTANDFTALNQACLTADKIYIVMHGDPRKAQFGLATGSRRLCRYDQLAVFLLRAMPQRNARYTISMIMCYAARSTVWQHALVDHQGKVPKQHLATSFAYRVFREICTLRDVRMTARTGRVNHNAQSGIVSVEEDMAVDEYIAEDEYKSDITQNNAGRLAVVNLAKQQFLLGGGTQLQWTTMWNKHLLNANAAAVGPEEAVIKPYLAWFFHGKNDVQQAYAEAVDTAGASERAKYGKFVYTYDQGKLKITNRYGNPHSTKMKANTVLYSGPLL